MSETEVSVAPFPPRAGYWRRLRGMTRPFTKRRCVWLATDNDPCSPTWVLSWDYKPFAIYRPATRILWTPWGEVENAGAVFAVRAAVAIAKKNGVPIPPQLTDEEMALPRPKTPPVEAKP